MLFDDGACTEEDTGERGGNKILVFLDGSQANQSRQTKMVETSQLKKKTSRRVSLVSL